MTFKRVLFEDKWFRLLPYDYFINLNPGDRIWYRRGDHVMRRATVVESEGIVDSAGHKAVKLLLEDRAPSSAFIAPRHKLYLGIDKDTVKPHDF